MIKKSIYVLLSITLVFVLIGCQKDEAITNSSYSVSSIDLAISDPEIKKEIEFMREKKIISEALYQSWLTAPKSQIIDEVDILINTSGDGRHDEHYRITPVDDGSLTSGMMYDEELLSRTQVQEMMRKENNWMNLAISDPQIKKEVEFMLSYKIIDEETYQNWLTLSKKEMFFTGVNKIENWILQPQEYYMYAESGASDGFMLERRDVQKMMKSRWK